MPLRFTKNNNSEVNEKQSVLIINGVYIISYAYI